MAFCIVIAIDRYHSINYVVRYTYTLLDSIYSLYKRVIKLFAFAYILDCTTLLANNVNLES